jgi:hypothetical protein
MRRIVFAAALAGAGLVLPAAASAAVFAPAAGAMSDQARSSVVQVQQQRQIRSAPRVQTSRPAFRAAPNRGAVRHSAPNRTIHRQVGPGRVVAPGRAIGPGRTAGPGRGFAPGRAVVHHRGFRPQGYVRWHPRHLVYHRWSYRPYYGRIIGGVAIGTLLAASAYYAYASAPPAPGLCWFWADPDEVQGYWDYCVDPG